MLLVLAAGAMAPVGAWTAATGSVAVPPWLVLLIIFSWTPPHFWSLAIKYRQDYASTGLPILPTVSGNKTALKHILIYTVALFGVSATPLLVDFGWIYAAIALPL